ncbi:MAG TPA: adenylate/guanylate cyclase domain-containing protein [Gemmatimonadota bacterium]|nr:adenylate/guanylate cyclase domain-containing protein [Gemmatimonadota bacterium]
MSTLHRHLAAVWFADIAGYTSLSEENEGEAVRLAHAFQRAARAVCERFGGRIVKAMGDGALAEFSSTEMAARSAHALHAAFDEAAREAGLSAGGLRVGVHVGDVAATDDGDLYGDGVNVASRIQAAAVPGEVWVSEDVWRQLRRRPELRFDPRGEHELKGIGQPMQAHALSVLDEEGWTPPVPSAARATVQAPGRLAAMRRRPLAAGLAVLALLVAGVVAGLVLRDRGGLAPTDALAENAAPGLAVVPFSVNDPELERWEEGLVDLLSTNLDGAGGLRTIDSRTVLARWRELVPEGGVADLPTALEVARRSGGKYGLVGSAVSSGASMRLVTDVYDLESGETLGQSQVEGSPDSIFGLVDRLSIQVLGIILEQGSGTAHSVDLASVTTSSLPALKSFLDGEEHTRRGDFAGAIPAYQDAIGADSTFALAHVRLGDAFGWTGGYETPGVRESYAAAKRFADRLPERDSNLLDVTLAYANAKEDATRLARDASQRYPDDPTAWYLLGEVYYHLPYQSLASKEDKWEPFERAFALDPTFLPAEIHLLDLAFEGADKAAADSLMPHFRQVTAGSDHGKSYSLLYTITFGDSASQARALASLDTMPHDVLRQLPSHMNHPRFADVQQAVIGELQSRPEHASVARFVDFFYGQALLNWGELETLEEVIEGGILSPAAAQSALGTAYYHEIPLSQELYDGLFASRADPAPGPEMAAAAFGALETGDRPTALRLMGGIRAARQSLLEAGDSATAKEVGEILEGLEARDAMLRKRPEALALLEAAYRKSGFPPAGIWAAELLEERGETERAIEFLEALGSSPLLGMRLGGLYEKVGRREDAIEAYGWVLLAWEEADPRLQPRVSEARQAIARLEGLQRD